jgi:hypothetical protein
MGDVIRAVPQTVQAAALTPSAANLVPQKAPSCAASGCGTNGPLFRGTITAATGALAAKEEGKKENYRSAAPAGRRQMKEDTAMTTAPHTLIDYIETNVYCTVGRNSKGDYEGLYWSDRPSGDGWVEVRRVEGGTKALLRRIRLVTEVAE